MKLYLRLIYIVFIYLMSNNKWTLVESTDTSPASAGRDNHTSGKIRDGSPATPTSSGKIFKKSEEASSDEEDMHTDPNEHSMRGGGHGSFGNDSNEHGMTYGSGPMTGGHGMKGRESFGKDPNEHSMTYGSGFMTGGDGGSFGRDPNGGMTGGKGMPYGGTEEGSKTGVSLNLKVTGSTSQYNYNKSGQIVTFTAKDKYAFKSVKTKGTVVWETNNPDEYATKVVLNGKGKKKKTVTITLLNGTTKSYKKDSNTWSEVDSNVTNASQKQDPFSRSLYS